MNEFTKNMCTFLEKSPTPYQAVAQMRVLLEKAGFEEIYEASPWKLVPGKKYYVTRNGSTLAAFTLPENGYCGFMIGASHTDSPSFKIKPNPEIEQEGMIKLNVEKYGSPLYAPWFDRPLSVAGRLMVQDEDTIRDIPVMIDEDLCIIPHLAIHMEREANLNHEYNVQTELLPIIGPSGTKGYLKKRVAKEAGVDPDSIIGSDLFLYPRMAPSVWGPHKEFISAHKLDDLQCAYGSLLGFLKSSNDSSVPVYVSFDNEEVGSLTKQGADSSFLSDVLERISYACGKTPDEHKAALNNSFIVSTDNAHAAHPNYPEKSDPTNRPVIGKGIVLKYNANQKYTTDAISEAFFRKILKDCGLSSQVFVNRSDMRGGSTLGNLLNAHVPCPTIDIGLPQWAMHSCYETAGIKDTEDMVKAMNAFFSSTLKDNAHTFVLRNTTDRNGETK